MSTIKHYSEAELLETYYMRPDQSAPVMQHLRTCDDCIARYNRQPAVGLGNVRPAGEMDR